MRDKQVDFDALLSALGAADAEPPPLMRQLLSGLDPVVEDNADARALAELEAWLAVLLDERRERRPTR